MIHVLIVVNINIIQTDNLQIIMIVNIIYTIIIIIYIPIYIYIIIIMIVITNSDLFFRMIDYLFTLLIDHIRCHLVFIYLVLYIDTVIGITKYKTTIILFNIIFNSFDLLYLSINSLFPLINGHLLLLNRIQNIQYTIQYA